MIDTLIAWCVLQVEKDGEAESQGLTVWEGGAAGDDAATGVQGSGGAYGDAETRAFYEDTPDLLAMVPLTVLGFTMEQVMFVLNALCCAAISSWW